MPKTPSRKDAVSTARDRCRALLLALALATICPSAQAGNTLAGHPSPYLAMHAQDPVDWQTWQQESVARARNEDKLLYLSVGYFSCHWCHVMHRESYLDAGIAAVLNEHFVPVKIDRELQPALDAHLMEFMLATRGHAGWPLNVFLTPEGYPLIATTYLPPDQFRALLARLEDRWRQDAQGLGNAAMQAAAAIESRRPAAESERLDSATARGYEIAFVRDTARLADLDNGGFGTRAKFPTTPQLRQLLHISAQSPDPALKDFLHLTLERMNRRGMRDHLGGGFFRYTTDVEWRVPHFEKMLYDNALLAELYLDASELFDDAGYRTVATETLDFMLRELWQDGALIASLSSVDDRDVEGGYYLWQDATLEQILDTREFEVAALAWDLRDEPTLEHGRLPGTGADDAAIARTLTLPPAEVAELRRDAHAILLARRAERGLPRDVKHLAGWNGLALAVLARAARESGEQRYLDASRRLRTYLVEVLWDGEQLVRAAGPAGAIGTASLQDYAFTARGLLAYSELSGADEDFALTRAIVDAAWSRFRSARGWRQSVDALIPYGSDEGSLPTVSCRRRPRCY